MELTPRLRLMNWLVRQGLTGTPENDLLRGFCERCRSPDQRSRNRRRRQLRQRNRVRWSSTRRV